MLALLKSMLAQNSYTLFTRPYELNIVGIRSNSTASNRFDDTLHVFYRERVNGVLRWQHEQFSITTDPGTYWLSNPAYETGTAILKPGQYRNAYQIGLHHGKYEALVQAHPVSILRDYDRDAVLDFFNGTSFTGLFGINIHRANAVGTTKIIDHYSAGCQVFANAEDFARFMLLCKKHAKLYGNAFTYTLFDQRAKERTNKLIAVTGLAAATALTFLGIGIYLYLEEKEEKSRKAHQAGKKDETLSDTPDDITTNAKEYLKRIYSRFKQNNHGNDL